MKPQSNSTNDCRSADWADVRRERGREMWSKNRGEVDLMRSSHKHVRVCVEQLQSTFIHINTSLFKKPVQKRLPREILCEYKVLLDIKISANFQESWVFVEGRFFSAICDGRFHFIMFLHTLCSLSITSVIADAMTQFPFESPQRWTQLNIQEK